MSVPVAKVRGVERPARLMRVPHAPAVLAGVANVGGAVLPVVSLARLMGLEEGLVERMVVYAGETTCGLLVAGVGALVHDAPSADRSAEIEQWLRAAFGTVRDRSAADHRVAGSAPPAAEDAVALLSCFAGRQEFGLALSEVEEVLRPRTAIERLPGSDAAVRGTIDHRGEVMPVVSLPGLLGLPARSDRAAERIVVIRAGRHRIGLATDAIGEVLRVAERLIDPLPAILRRGAAEARIRAICRLDDGRRLVSVLAAEQLVPAQLAGRQVVETVGQEAAQVAEQWLAVRIGTDELALPLAAVEEVAKLPAALVRLPGAPPFVGGVMNLHGQVLPVIDHAGRAAREMTGMAARRVVVVKAGVLRAGLLVDAVTGLAREGSLPIVSPEDLLGRAQEDLRAAFADRAPRGAP